MKETTPQTMLPSGDTSWTNESDAALMKAVTAKDVTKIKFLLQTSNCPHCASADILDHAFMQLVMDNSAEAIAVLKTLLTGGASTVSSKALYSVLSLMRLVNMEALLNLTDIVSTCTSSYGIKGALLQALIHFKLTHLVKTLVNSGLDLKAFWDDKFDMRDSMMCATNIDQYTRDRLLPPEIAAIFISATSDDNTLRMILRDILAYTDADKTEAHNLLVLLITAGYEPNNMEMRVVEKKFPATASWYSQHASQTSLPSNKHDKNRAEEELTKLNSICELKGFPAQLKALLLMDIYKNKQINSS